MCRARPRRPARVVRGLSSARISIYRSLSLVCLPAAAGRDGPSTGWATPKDATVSYLDGVKRTLRAVTSNVPPLALKLNSKVPRGLLRLVNLTRIVQSTYANRETQTEMPCHADAQSCSSLAIIRLTYLLHRTHTAHTHSHTHGTHISTHTRTRVTTSGALGGALGGALQGRPQPSLKP